MKKSIWIQKIWILAVAFLLIMDFDVMTVKAQDSYLAQGKDGNWYYYVDGAICPYNGLKECNGAWWCVENGTINWLYTGLWHDELVGWWHVNGGRIDFSYTGFVPNEFGWWYVQDGRVAFERNGVVEDSCCGNWYLAGGRIDFSYTGDLTQDGKTYHILNGSVVSFEEDKTVKCNLPKENKYYKYEYAYRTEDTSALTAADLKFYTGLKAYLDDAYQYDTPFLQEKAIHDYMILHTAYDYDRLYNGTIPMDSYYPEGLIVNGLAVCDGYRKTFQLFMDILGIECIGVTGKGNGGAHAWNQVKLDGEWYVVDVTWDDPVPDRPGEISYNYFNVTTEKINQNHVAESNPPEANGTKYNYLQVLVAEGKYTIVTSDIGVEEFSRMLNTEWYTRKNEKGEVVIRIEPVNGDTIADIIDTYPGKIAPNYSIYGGSYSIGYSDSYFEFIFKPVI